MTDYREPIKLKHVEESGGLGIQRTHNEVTAEIDISDEDGKRAMHMLKNGLACPNCYLTFPAVPSAGTLKEFEGTFNLFPINIDVQRDRIKRGGCNLCGFVVTDDNIEKTVRDEAKAMLKSLYDSLEDEQSS